MGCHNLKDLYFWSDNVALNGDIFGGETPQDLTIWGRRGSPAEHYANAHQIEFQMLDW